MRFVQLTSPGTAACPESPSSARARLHPCPESQPAAGTGTFRQEHSPAALHPLTQAVYGTTTSLNVPFTPQNPPAKIRQEQCSVCAHFCLRSNVQRTVKQEL